MKRTRWSRWAVGITAAGALGPGVAACRSAGDATVGVACIPSDEWLPSFAGYDEDEVSMQPNHPACGRSHVCLVNHFRGRLSCPYGQQSWDPPGQCTTPDGADVVVPVPTQLKERSPERSVYCSCRCANAAGRTDDGGDYCKCPKRASCQRLVDDLGLSSGLEGSYCVLDGTTFDPNLATGAECDRLNMSCGPADPLQGLPPPTHSTPSRTVLHDSLLPDSPDKLDLLFMVDNSIGMIDVQRVLRASVPALISRLIDPPCVGSGAPVAAVEGRCPSGTHREFEPVADIHVGVVTSSLGGHGGVLCSPDAGEKWGPAQDDHGMLLGTPGLRANVPSHEGQGFLAWDATGRAGSADRAEFIAELEQTLDAVGETGCGFESSLEGWYRFLLDPQPPLQVVKSPSGVSEPQGINTALLEQRARFLRPDSVVAIVMVTDENDCSIRDDGWSWLVGDQTQRMPRATAACAASPNSPCCRSCALAEAAPPHGCLPLSSDPECAKGGFQTTEEQPGLRCFQQKRRFGIDFLYPTERYVDALNGPLVYGRPCTDDSQCPPVEFWGTPGTCEPGKKVCSYPSPLLAPNPFYPELLPRTGPFNVFLAGIIGVPWHSLATPTTRDDPNALEFVDRYGTHPLWADLLGDPALGVPPREPYMVESIEPRTTLPLGPLGLPVLPVGSLGGASPVNGHEFSVPNREDLQNACTFPLPPEWQRDCVDSYEGSCACKQSEATSPDRPLCQAPGTTTSTVHQYAAMAKPALRQLEVLKGFGHNSILASACPKSTDLAQGASPVFGYHPAMQAIGDRLAEAFYGHRCLPRPLPIGADGELACRFYEATPATLGVECGGAGRTQAPAAAVASVRQEVRRSGRCEGGCDEVVVCELTPATGAERTSCLEAPEFTGIGYCYLDAALSLGNPELLAACDSSQQRWLRFGSASGAAPVPHRGATVFLACTGPAR